MFWKTVNWIFLRQTFEEEETNGWSCFRTVEKNIWIFRKKWNMVLFRTCEKFERLSNMQKYSIKLFFVCHEKFIFTFERWLYVEFFFMSNNSNFSKHDSSWSMQWNHFIASMAIFSKIQKKTFSKKISGNSKRTRKKIPVFFSQKNVDRKKFELYGIFRKKKETWRKTKEPL